MVAVNTDGVYDYNAAGQQWSSQFVRDSSWRPSPDQRQKIDQAMWANDMNTPMDLLRSHAPFNVVAIPATPGQPTITDVLSMTAGQAPQQTFSDFTGTPAGRDGSMFPSLPPM
jgi:hypothetical protein